MTFRVNYFHSNNPDLLKKAKSIIEAGALPKSGVILDYKPCSLAIFGKQDHTAFSLGWQEQDDLQTDDETLNTYLKPYVQYLRDTILTRNYRAYTAQRSVSNPNELASIGRAPLLIVSEKNPDTAHHEVGITNLSPRPYKKLILLAETIRENLKNTGD